MNEERRKVKIRIANNDYTISTDDDEKYLNSLSTKLNKDLMDFTNSTRMSVLDALIFTAMNYLDDYYKSMSSADTFRVKIREYSEDLAKARAESQELKKENERLIREISQMRKTLEQQQNAVKVTPQQQQQQSTIVQPNSNSNSNVNKNVTPSPVTPQHHNKGVNNSGNNNKHPMNKN